MDITQLTTFIGWCTVINLGLLILTSLFIVGARTWMTGVHARMFGVNESELPGMYVQWLGNYKIAVYVLSLVPFLALKAMA